MIVEKGFAPVWSVQSWLRWDNQTNPADIFQGLI